MKITINGSPKEVSELLETLRDGVKEAEKTADLPPLLTELAEDEKINELAEAVRHAGKENAPQAETVEQVKPFLINDLGNRGYRKSINQKPCGSENQANGND